LYSGAVQFFNGGTRADSIFIGVSSGNAAAGNTVADFTDFKRGI